MEKIHIAIDGPAGAGKSTVARLIAEKLHITYIDTGAMYRALTFKILESTLGFEDIESIIEIARETSIELDHNKVFLDGKNVTEEIRQPVVNSNVSQIAQISEVRSRMVELQRQIAQGRSVVMDGRDIGTHVLPKAPNKFFLTASIDERAYRRYIELKEKGFDTTLKDIKSQIKQRDKMDQERTVSPLVPAKDAVIIDTSAKSIETVVYEIITLINRR